MIKIHNSGLLEIEYSFHDYYYNTNNYVLKLILCDFINISISAINKRLCIKISINN